MNDHRLEEATRLEEKDKNFEKAIALCLEIVRDDPSCIEAYIHLAADSGILKRYRQAEQYARVGLRINPDYGRARYYLACALRDQLRLEEASVEMEKALALVRRDAYRGSIAERQGIQLPLFGWNKHVEQDAMGLRMQLLLPGNRKRGSIYDAPNFTPKPGGMKTYRNDRHGFEIDVPENWQAVDPSAPFNRFLDPIGKIDPHDFFQFNCREEAFNFVINPLGLEPALKNTENEFMIWAQDHHFYEVVLGRISVGEREHVTAHYYVLDGLGKRWNKKYMIVFGGIEYAITGTCDDAQFFAGREGDWDAIVKTFRLLVPVDAASLNNYQNRRLLEQRQEFTERRQLVRQVGGVTYGQAYDAVTLENYALARSLLAQCLKEDPDHLLAHKEMAVVLKKLGDKRGALRQRREVKRLDPADTINRFDLVDLLAGCGYRKEAGREADELIAMEPSNALFQQLKEKLRKQPNYQMRFLAALVYMGFVIYEALAGGMVMQAYWLAAIGCVPAAHYFNQGGPWMGLNRNNTNWLTLILYLIAVMSLLYKLGLGLLMIVLFFPVFSIGMAVISDNQAKD